MDIDDVDFIPKPLKALRYSNIKEIEDMLMAADLYFKIKIVENYKFIPNLSGFENINNKVETTH